jgi:hypothetical protein
VVVTDQSGAAVPDAEVSVLNTETGANRSAPSGPDGSIVISGLLLTGHYKISVSKSGFTAEDLLDVTLRAGQTARFNVKLVATGGTSVVTVVGTTAGVHADPQLALHLDSDRIDETPILGRKVTTLPLLNSAFRQAKGTGDLFVNATYFVTGAGGRRETTVTLDGANNDEAWGRQTMITTVPIGAIQETAVLSNAFSSEYGWTAGPAINIVTKSGTNALHGEALYLGRPGSWEAESFSTDHFCAPSISTCEAPSNLTAISAVDIPDVLHQFSGAIGGPVVRDRTFFFASGDYTHQDRTTPLSAALPSFVLPATGSLEYTGRYRQKLLDARGDHRLSASQNLMVRANLDRMFDTNPQDTVGGTNAPTVARTYSRSTWATQISHNAVLGPRLFNEVRFAYLNGDPVTRWEPDTLSTTYTRGGPVPFTIGQSRAADMFGHQAQLSDTLSWSRGSHYVRFGGSLTRHTSGGTGSEFGSPVLGTFSFRNTTTAPFERLTIVDVQQYSQPTSYGITRYELTQWMTSLFVQDSVRARHNLTFDLGVRYDYQGLSDARANIAPRIGFGWHPNGDARTVVRGGYGMYYTQIRSNLIGNALLGGLDGLTTYTAIPGQLGFPDCLTCVPLSLDPKLLAPSQLPARDITIRAGDRAFYREQFARYGLNFDALPYYPDEFVNPRSQVTSVGVERELREGLFVSADYVNQHWTNLDQTVDLNAPLPFDRTAPGQTRSVAAANATRSIAPVAGGIRRVNVLMNLGTADYSGLQTEVRYRTPKLFASLGYTLSKATNTTEPDGNGVGPNQLVRERMGEEERGPSLLDQRHRAVINLSYLFPSRVQAGTLIQFASARPFTAFTGVDNDGDGSNTDRPVVNGNVIGRSAFRSTGTSEVALFVETRIPLEHTTVVLRLEGFNLFNHGNYLGRGQQTWGNGETPNATFGALASVPSTGVAIPAFANVDPPRMFQLQARLLF